MSYDAWHSMRASDADRDRAADVIKAAFAEGRLTHEEHGQRLQQVSAARTYGELQEVIRDLPTGALPSAGSAQPPAIRQSWPPATLPAHRKTNDLAVASIVCGGLGFMTGITAIPAIITGHLALSKIRQTGEDGRGLAIAGLVMGYTLAIGALLMVLMVVGMIAAVAGSGPVGPVGP